MFLGALQPWHLIVVLVIVLVIFGPAKLPQLGKSLGQGLKEFKTATTELGKGTEATTPAAGTGAAAGKTCPTCERAVTAEMKFCGSCGASLAAPVPAVR